MQRNELAKDEALLAARLLQASDIELIPIRFLLETATRIAIELDHPAYDSVYIALAVERDCQFVTAEERLVRKIAKRHRGQFHDRVIALTNSS